MQTCQQRGVPLQTGYIDYDKLEEKALDFRPRMLICGGSAYPREWDYKRLREIADKVGAYLMSDMAHIRSDSYTKPSKLQVCGHHAACSSGQACFAAACHTCHKTLSPDKNTMPDRRLNPQSGALVQDAPSHTHASLPLAVMDLLSEQHGACQVRL